MARPPGLSLRAYLAVSHLIPLAAPFVLRRRLARGREDAARWREKLGHAGLPRPAGPLVWMHAVGLGEVMALRGLIAAMPQDLSFLVTSSARSSAQVFGANLPDRTRHQYLPLDAPGYLRRFLDHWQPDLSVWAEQDLWPGAVIAADRRGTPLALVNARMDAAAFARRRRAAAVYRDLMSRFALVAAQDAGTAGHLALLGARGVQVTGSLKAASPPLAADPSEVAGMQAALAGRRVWLAASTHAGDEAVVLEAHRALMAEDPSACLVLVPRVPDRAAEVTAAARGLAVTLRSAGGFPGPGVFLVDRFGELGLWYRVARVALVGGGFGIGGHNPWEPAHLGCAVLHGSGVANFAADYGALHAADAAVQVTTPGDVLTALDDPAMASRADRAQGLARQAAAGLAPLAGALAALVRR
ncbi:MAG: 3-deoxy-D-manno-octulosonic acid transferase [Gemmobacter sp.]